MIFSAGDKKNKNKLFGYLQFFLKKKNLDNVTKGWELSIYHFEPPSPPPPQCWAPLLSLGKASYHMTAPFFKPINNGSCVHNIRKIVN